jgi:lipoprotein-releasing system ATP-binding protein
MDPDLLSANPAGWNCAQQAASRETRALVLELVGITKGYPVGRGRLTVLQDLHGRFEGGRCYTIEGVSGSGKTTLLHVAGGLEVPDSGQVIYCGRELSGYSRKELALWRAREVGFVFQSYHLLSELTVWENVELPAMLLGSHDRSRAMELLREVGLESRAEDRVYELSGGEQQRVAIARALRNDPTILLADEPTGNLDAVTGQDVIRLLLFLCRKRGKTLIVATHDTRIAEQGDQRLRLTQGRLQEVKEEPPRGERRGL